MRLFVAAELDEEAKGKVEEVIGKLNGAGADVKWVETENLHITLKFLGEVPEGRVKEVEEHVKEAVEGMKPFRVRLQGVGYFGSPRFVRVVWAGVKEGEEELRELMRRMDERLGYIRKDEFQHSAHLTLGRPSGGGNREGLLREMKELEDVKICEFDVKFVRLKQSILGREGPQYSDVKVFPLGEGV